MPDAPSTPAATDSVAAFERARAEILRQKRVQGVVFATVFLACLTAAVVAGQFNLFTLLEGLPRTTEYIEKLLPVLRWETLGPDVAEWYWNIGDWLELLVETLLMAFFATLLGTIGAFFLSFPASSNLTTASWLYFVTRRFLEISRSIPDLVYALVFVFAWGLGPLAGILALAIHTMGASGKLFAEVNENIDGNPLEGVRAAGGNWVEMIRFAVVPQVLPVFTSYTLWRFEINVRTAAVLGFVGAGGIGYELYTNIRLSYYEDVSAILLIIIVAVICVDLSCEQIRHRMIGKEFI
ncbi:MAG: phosphonate ABC transporter, permease protein PhnE [Thermoguttaceae bacterium]